MSDTNKEREALKDARYFVELYQRCNPRFEHEGVMQDPSGVNACLERIDTVLALAPGLSGWQEIASAPKDGTGILLGFNDEEFGGFVGQGRWHEEDHDGPDNMGHDAGFMDDQYDFFKCARSFGNPAYQSKGLQPTHWQPLPAAPGIAPHQPKPEQHPDDAAVDAFAALMKAKMAKQRSKGYGGWETCPVERLQRMLNEHIPKGDPVDVANFAMMLSARGEATVQQQPEPTSKGEPVSAQEAAEFSVRLSEFAIAAHRGESARMAVLADVLKSMFEAHVSATQEAGKPEVPNTFKRDGECEDQWIDRITGASKEAGKVEAVADERAMAVVSRHPGLFDERTSAVARLLPEGEHLADGTKLYLRPSQQALGEDAKDAARYRWLRAKKEITLLTTFFGNGCVNKYRDDIDNAIDAAILAAAGGSEK